MADKLIKYRNRFVVFCLMNGYDVEAIRRHSSVTVYQCTPAERHKYGAGFIIGNPESVEIRKQKENSESAIKPYSQHHGYIHNIYTL